MKILKSAFIVLGLVAVFGYFVGGNPERTCDAPVMEYSPDNLRARIFESYDAYGCANVAMPEGYTHRLFRPKESTK
jgi:hypothetical protein